MSFLILKKKLKLLKPKWLKSSFIKGEINNFIFEIWYRTYKKKKTENTKNVLINITEAMGDTIVKLGAVEVIRKKYGNDKIYVLVNDKWEDILKRMNFNVVSKTKGYRRGFKDRIKLIKKLDEIGFETIIDFSFVYDQGLISKLSYKNLIKLEDYMKKDENYVLYPIYRMVKEEIESTISFEEIKPNLKPYYNLSEECITVGVGASHESKVFPPEKMIEVLRAIQEKYPKENIYLLGANKKQSDYARKVVKELKSEKVVDLVNKISLIETIETIAKSKLYVGFDSGLYHVAYSLKKNIIVFFGRKSGFEHLEKNIHVIMGNGENPIKDGFYGNEVINSIDVEYMKKLL